MTTATISCCKQHENTPYKGVLLVWWPVPLPKGLSTQFIRHNQLYTYLPFSYAFSPFHSIENIRYLFFPIFPARFNAYRTITGLMSSSRTAAPMITSMSASKKACQDISGYFRKPYTLHDYPLTFLHHSFARRGRSMNGPGYKTPDTSCWAPLLF